MVRDVPEPPIAFATSITVPENFVGPVGYVRAMDSDYEFRVNVTVGCRDSCGLSYAIIGGGYGLFDVDNSSGLVTVTGVGLDYEDVAYYIVTVRVKDVSGFASTCNVYVTVTDVPDCEITSALDLSGRRLTNVSTGGGLPFLIQGTNFGPTIRRMRYTNMKLNDTVITNATLGKGSSVGPTRTGFPIDCCVHDMQSYENTMLLCTTPPGYSMDLHPTVTIRVNYRDGEPVHQCQTTSKIVSVSYAVPTITSAYSPNSTLLTTGGDLVVLGTNLGSYGNSILSYSNQYVSNSTVCLTKQPSTILVCKVGAGIGSNLSLRIYLGGQASSIYSSSVSYEAPRILSVSAPSNNISAGGAFVIIGVGLGDSISHVLVQYGSVAPKYFASCTFKQIQYSLTCVFAVGVGSNLVFQVTVGSQTSMIYRSTLSYNVPVLLSVTGPGSQYSRTAGGDVVYLSGLHFGPVPVSQADSEAVVALYGDSSVQFQASNCSVISTDRMVRCWSGVGVGAGLRWRVVVGGQSSALSSESTSYAPPVILSLTGGGSSSATSEGGQVVYVNGLNFGPSYRYIRFVRYVDSYSDSVYDVTGRCNMSVSQVQLTCVTLPGAGANLLWEVNVYGQTSSLPVSSYSLPVISSVTAVTSQDDYNVLPSLSVDGGDNIIIFGTGFGPPSRSSVFVNSVTYGPTGTEYRAVNCSVVSSSRISCRSGAGVGASLYWKVSIDGQSSALSLQAIGYEIPSIFSIAPATLSTEGGLITIRGSGYSKLYPPYVTVDGTACPSVLSSDGREVRVVVPELRTVVHSTRVVCLTVGGQISAANLSTTAPTLSSVLVTASSNQSLPYTLTLFGSSFSLSPQVFIKRNIRDGDLRSTQILQLPCHALSHSEIVCYSDSSYGNVSVAVGPQTSNQVPFTYGSPQILSSELEIGTGRTEGDTVNYPEVLEITGQFLGDVADDISVLFVSANGTSHNCVVTSFHVIPVSDGKLWYATAAGVDTPSIVDVQQDLQLVSCRVPSGSGTGNTIRVVRRIDNLVSGQICNCLSCGTVACFSYLPPLVTELTRSSGPALGGYRVTLIGDNFGTNPIVRVGGVQWAVLPHPANNHTHVTVEVPPGIGAQLTIEVAAGNQRSAANTSVRYSYDPPLLLPPSCVRNCSVTIVRGLSGAWTRANISGVNFGSDGLQGTFLVSLSNGRRLTVLYHQDSLVQGRGYRIFVNASGQISGSGQYIVNYDPPEINLVTPLNVTRGSIVTVTGHNFGSYDHGADVMLSIGGTGLSADSILFYNNTLIKFVVPPKPVGDNVVVNMSLLVSGQIAMGFRPQFHYASSSIYSMRFMGRLSTAGGAQIVIQGHGFLTTSASDISIRITDPWHVNIEDYASMIDVLCPVSVVNSTTVLCTVPPGEGQNLIAIARIGSASRSIGFSYEAPEITGFLQTNGGDAAGGEL
eukprot:gene3170-3910_t